MASLEAILKLRIVELKQKHDGTPDETQYQAYKSDRIRWRELETCLEIYEREKLVEQSEPSGDDINAV